MNNKFKKGSRVLVFGFGENDGTIYNGRRATIVESDPYFKDYHVKFDDGTEDWILPKYLIKLYVFKERKNG